MLVSCIGVIVCDISGFGEVCEKEEVGFFKKWFVFGEGNCGLDEICLGGILVCFSFGVSVCI